MKTITPYQLGASLYIPAIRPEIEQILFAEKYPDLRSVILCCEDTIHEHQRQLAAFQLQKYSSDSRPFRPLVFVRVRDIAFLEQVLQIPGADKFAGFVLPKFDNQNIDRYLGLFTPECPWYLMPTLETPETFDPNQMIRLRDRILNHQNRSKVLLLRFGAHDLLKLLFLKRRLHRTIYETPLGHTIASLITTFRPYDLQLAAPVYDGFHQTNTLQREVEQDLDYGMWTKSAIHPSQVPVIQQLYKVNSSELETAQLLLDPSAPAIFGHQGKMCEIQVQRNWASSLLQRANHFGVITERRQFHQEFG